MFKNLQTRKNNSKGEIYSNTDVPQENKQLKQTIWLHPKELEKEKQSPWQTEENNKDQHRNKWHRG